MVRALRRRATLHAIALCCFLAVPGALLSQDVRLSASADTNALRVGEQVRVTVSVEHPGGFLLRNIGPADSLEGLEIVGVDSTTPQAGDPGSPVRRVYTFTAFDSGTYVVPPFIAYYTAPSDTVLRSVSGAPIILFVRGVDVDTSAEIRAIKPPLDVPLTFAEILPYLLGIVAAVIIIWLVYYIVRKRKRGEKFIPGPPPRPADEIALEALRSIGAEKLWQRGMVKEYHTALSDVIRTYIERRFAMPAMESTSDEILSSPVIAGLVPGAVAGLRDALTRSDLVKFAKFIPPPEVNERSIADSISFVELTRKANVAPRTSGHEEAASSGSRANETAAPDRVGDDQDTAAGGGAMTFANPEYFWLLLLVPLLIYWYIRKGRISYTDIRVPTLLPFASGRPGWKVRLTHLPVVLRVSALALVIVALARPQTTSEGENVSTEGIDIVLVTDVSGSMLAEDFRPNRIEAAKAVAAEFIDGRPDDRIGFVVFAGESFTQCPLTLDHAVVKDLIAAVKSGLIEDGTAIGMGLATAVSRLKDSQSKSKVIILLTDGVNNKGVIDPMTAAGIASTFGIRVYTVGVGTIGMAPYPVQTPLGTQYRNVPVEIDEELLKQIAVQTGGTYFRATDNDKLQLIYAEIDRLEKTKIEVTQFRRHKEDFYTAGFLAGFLLLGEVLLSLTFFRKIP